MLSTAGHSPSQPGSPGETCRRACLRHAADDQKQSSGCSVQATQWRHAPHITHNCRRRYMSRRGLPRAAGGVSTTTCLLADGRGGRSTGRCDPILPGPRSRTEPTGPWRLPSGTACCTIPCTPVLVIFCRVSVTPGPPCRSSVKLVPSEPEFALGERVGAVR